MTKLVRSQIFLSCILLAACGLGGTSLVTADTPLPPPIARYTFTTEQCMNGSFTDTPNLHGSPMPSFSRNLVSTKCSKGLGVEGSSNFETVDSPDISPLSMETSSANKIFQQVEQTNEGVSFEFWLKPLGEDRAAFSTIFTVGSKDGSTGDGGRNVCDQGHFDFQLVEIDSKFQVTFRSSESFFSPCFRYPVFDVPVQSGKLVHIVIALRENHQQVFFNAQGETVATEAFSNDLDHWKDEPTMHFFSHLGSTAGSQEDLWRGSVYQFSVYDRALSQQEVERSLQAGLSGGLPYSLPYQVVINEDAERMPGSHAPEWYDSPPLITSRSQYEAEDLQRLPLRIGTVEEEVHELLTSVTLGRTSLHQESHVPSPHFVYITSLPSKGRLYQFSGQFFAELQRSPQQSDDAPIAILIEDPSSLIFLPGFNEFSEISGAKYTDISYCVTSHVIFDPRQCESSVISVFVEAVNDPPVAFSSPPSLSTTEGLDWEILPSIELGGTDIDRKDFISTIQISEPPRWGKLILRVTDFRDDGIVHGTIISEASAYTFASQEGKSIHVKYVFGPSDPTTPMHPIPGNDASDHFSFRVSDRDGVWSLQKSVRVDIASALVARHVQATAQLSYGSNITTVLHGDDTSGYQRPLAYFLETVPNHGSGWLLHSATGKRLLPGSTIQTDGGEENDNSAAIAFVPNVNSCNDTQLKTTGNFTYRAVALEDRAPVSVSPAVTQSLDAQCFYIPTLKLSASTESFVLQTFSLISAREIGCGASVYVQPRFSAACSTMAGINGIKVTASEYHTNPVLVTLLPGNGFITFNDAFWRTVKPIRGRRNMATEEVTFQAHPEDLQDILTGLSFRSQTIGDDVLTISVQYGDCFGELINAAANVSSCQRVNLAIPVHVTGGEQDDVYEPVSTPLRWQVWVSWFIYPVFYGILAIFKDILKTATSKARAIILAAAKCVCGLICGPIVGVVMAVVQKVKATIIRGSTSDETNKRAATTNTHASSDRYWDAETGFDAIFRDYTAEITEGGCKWISRATSRERPALIWWNIETGERRTVPPPKDEDSYHWKG